MLTFLDTWIAHEFAIYDKYGALNAHLNCIWFVAAEIQVLGEIA